jgi:uncharacterized protein (TIGR02145 family)
MIDKQIYHYHIQSKLGEGGMATVYRAEHRLLKTSVAVKVLKEDFVRNQHIRNRFIAEAQSMAQMSHVHIVKVTDLIDEGDTVAFVMEHIEGETLKQFMDHKGKLSEKEINAILPQMLEALAYVHDQQLVHRDVKPSNFMIDKSGKVKLMDFGIAKQTDAASAEYTQTGTGIQMGTPMYMSPEQITETKSVTSQSDLYSLGVILWQMSSGKKPYDTNALSTFQLQTKIVNEALPETHTQWDAMIHRATAKKPSERFASCNHWKENIGKEMLRPSHEVLENEDATIIEERTRLIEKPSYASFPFVQIGAQVWMTENLNVDTFRNGEPIPHAQTAEEWMQAGLSKQPAWCYYDNDSANGEKFGKLYNWYAVNDSRGLAPFGWILPSNEDWGKFVQELGGDMTAGKTMKNHGEWHNTGHSIANIGFNACPSGRRNQHGIFAEIQECAIWWSSSELQDLHTWGKALDCGLGEIARFDYHHRSCGFSVRCVLKKEE